MTELEILFFYCGIAFAIAYFLGRKRHIGFGKSLFFNLLLSPIGGSIITFLSRKRDAPIPKPSTAKNVWGWILTVLFTLMALGTFVKPQGGGLIMLPMIGFIGLGLYLVSLSKEKK